MDNNIYAFYSIAVCSIVTIFIRALPFAIFGSKKLPATITYLGKVLPGAIMVILIIFCLRNIDFLNIPYGLPEISCLILCAILQLRFKNSILSILISTMLYMLIIRIV